MDRRHHHGPRVRPPAAGPDRDRISTHALAQRSGDKATEFAYIRRLETQADCFSGMFIRSVSVSLGVQQDDLEGIEAT